MSARGLLLFPITIAVVFLAIATRAEPVKSAWTAHIIAPHTGAISLQMRDVNQDGAPDLLVLFGDGALRVYQNPGKAKAGEAWTDIQAGVAPGATSATLLDTDADGRLDIVTTIDSTLKTILIQTAPSDTGGAWRSETLPDAPPLQWTAVIAADLDQRHARDIVAGARYQHARVGWFESLADPGESAGWRWHPLAEAGWVTALQMEDMNSDGAVDILYGDRFAEYRGVYWLENPRKPNQQWSRHAVTANSPETVHVTLGDVDGDGLVDVVSAAKPDWVWLHRRRAIHGREWQSYGVQVPAVSGTIHAVRLADVNRDGRPDLVIALEDAESGQSGIAWLTYRRSFAEDSWRPHDISGTGGGSFHGLEILDLDGDGDLDVLTSESRNIGIVWYENPSVTRVSTAQK